MQQSAGSIQLKLYEDGINLCGTAKVTLPSIAYVCTTLTGAGLMGNLEVPYIGMIDNMTMDVEWDSPTGDAVKLLTPRKHQLDLRVAEEYWDTQETDVGIWPDKYVRSPSFSNQQTLSHIPGQGREHRKRLRFPTALSVIA